MKDLIRTPKQLGNLIRTARKKADLSQSQLGEMTGLRQETISLIENGNPATRIDSILSVIAMLKLDLDLGRRKKSADFDYEDIL